MTDHEIARRIQHTNVRPDATRTDIERLLDECVRYGFDGAMVNPIWVPLAARRLEGTSSKVCTALDFPQGGGSATSVARDAAAAVADGAEQIDVMTKVGWLKSGMDEEYGAHLTAAVEAAGSTPVKAMLEVFLLTPDELARAVELCADAGIAYLKNSSGFDGGKATVEIVRSLVERSAGRMRVKASGGIRTLERAQALLDSGAELLGTSAGVAIVTGGRRPGQDGY